MNAPELQPAINPRWSVWRWLALLAVVLLAWVVMYGAMLGKRHRKRLAFQQRMLQQNVHVRMESNSLAVSWLEWLGANREQLDGLLGDVSVHLYAREPRRGESPALVVIYSSDQLQEALRAFQSDDEIQNLYLNGALIEDSLLPEIRANLHHTTVHFDHSNISEAGLREFCQSFRPATVVSWNSTISKPVLNRLATEFPEIAFEEIFVPGGTIEPTYDEEPDPDTEPAP